MIAKVSLPSNYGDNTLVLMMQTPKTLYAYWELSQNQRSALAEKKKLVLRLNSANRGVYRTYTIEPYWDSFYFTGVDPGMEYYCDISVEDGDNELYPIIYSNPISSPSVNTYSEPAETAGSNFWGKGTPVARESKWKGYSSGIFYN